MPAPRNFPFITRSRGIRQVLGDEVCEYRHRIRFVRVKANLAITRRHRNDVGDYKLIPAIYRGSLPSLHRLRLTSDFLNLLKRVDSLIEQGHRNNHDRKGDLCDDHKHDADCKSCCDGNNIPVDLNGKIVVNDTPARAGDFII
jgi:hypothetical protein